MELKVVVLLNRRGKSEGGRGGQAARGGVGMEVFRGLPADWLRHGNAQSGLTKCGRPSLALQAWDRRRERGVCRSRKQRCRPSDYNLAWTQIKYLGWSKTLARHSRSQYWTLFLRTTSFVFIGICVCDQPKWVGKISAYRKVVQIQYCSSLIPVLSVLVLQFPSAVSIKTTIIKKRPFTHTHEALFNFSGQFPLGRLVYQNLFIRISQSVVSPTAVTANLPGAKYPSKNETKDQMKIIQRFLVAVVWKTVAKQKDARY